MAIYIFNLLVGYMPGGVDNAQAYRAYMFDKLLVPVKYIFTELPTVRELEYYSGIGIPVNAMLCAHQYFTDNCSLMANVMIDEKLEELKESLRYTDIQYTGDEIRLLKNRDVIASILPDREQKDSVRCILYFKQGKMLRMETYTCGLLYVNYYITADSDSGLYAKMVRRTFYNQNGTVSYEQIFDGDKEWYLFPDGRCCTKSEFIGRFVEKLCLTEKDVVILDRFSQFEFVQPLFQFGNKARFIAVIHSGHYFEENESPYRLYLNGDYFYLFKYTKYIDTIVVSTQEQKGDLIEKLQEYGCCVPKVEVIPAGGISRLRYPDTKRKPYSLLSVSRLDKLKRIHWIMKSVIKAHQVNPEISLDVYGDGNAEYVQKLRTIIMENNAQQYIRLMGYADVTETYRNYEVFLSASLLETLGLSVMEAVGSGMAVIGLDVKYGNHLFVHSGKNGYLIELVRKNLEENGQQIDDMAEKIIEIFRDKKRLEEFHCYSYEIGREYLFQNIQEKWSLLLEGV